MNSKIDDASEVAEAIKHYEKAAKLQKETNQQQEYADSLTELGYLYHLQEQYGKAEALYQEALTLRKRLLGDEHAKVASSLHNLATLYWLQERYDQAEPLYQKALALRKKIFGDNHNEVFGSLINCRNHSRPGSSQDHRYSARP